MNTNFIEELEMKVAVILQKSHSCPKLQNPILGKAEKNLLPGEKVPFRADEGGEKDLPFRSVWLRDDLFMTEL